MEDEKPLEILKMFFGWSAEDGFAVEAMKGLPLARAQSGDDALYRVADGLLAAAPSHITTVLSALGQSIVPIVAMVPGENKMRCLGTGFFISATGLLITAAHVVLDPIERDYGNVTEIGGAGWDMSRLNLGVMIRTNPLFQVGGWIFKRIEWASLLATKTENPLPFGRRDLKLTSDISICKVEPPDRDLLYQPLSIFQPGMLGIGLGVGKRAFAIGYGAMQDTTLEQESTSAISGDFAFDLYVATGQILERFPDNDINKQVRTPGPCFSASLKLPPGMSGSPIFDDERIYVHGVVSSGLANENGPTDLGYGSMLSNSMSLPIRPLAGKNLIDLLNERQHGMIRLHIAGG